MQLSNQLVPREYSIFLTTGEAAEQSSAGDIVAVGYPNSHIVYRVAQSKDENGQPMNILNFQYIF